MAATRNAKRRAADDDQGETKHAKRRAVDANEGPINADQLEDSVGEEARGRDTVDDGEWSEETATDRMLSSESDLSPSPSIESPKTPECSSSEMSPPNPIVSTNFGVYAEPKISAEDNFRRAGWLPVKYVGCGSEGHVWFAVRRIDPTRTLRVVKWSTYGDIRECMGLRHLTKSLMSQTGRENPAFPTVIDSEEEHGRWIVLPYYTGQSLQRYLHEFGRKVPPTFILHIMIELIEAFHTMHEADQTHGDILVNNVMIDLSDRSWRDYPRLIVIDFGRSSWRGSESASEGLQKPLVDRENALEIPYLHDRPGQVQGVDWHFFDALKTADVEGFGELIHALQHRGAFVRVPNLPLKARRPNAELPGWCNPEPDRGEYYWEDRTPNLTGVAEKLYHVVEIITSAGLTDDKSFPKRRAFELLYNHVVPRAKQLRDLHFEPFGPVWEIVCEAIKLPPAPRLVREELRLGWNSHFRFKLRGSLGPFQAGRV
ncbi:MAG: hypothetical protein M1828_007595 [Chrysothrix sp. TS-e1954]|nr:MAG: hypothetical protein M1828_007595 [Chrysothrix sp. TS-e1954]